MARLKEQESGRRKEPLALWKICKDALYFALKDIWEDPELLEECYCPIRERPYDEESFIESINGYVKDFGNPQDAAPPTLPFVIYGDPGVGKTTFLHHTLRLVLSKTTPIRVICIDFLQIAAENLEVLKSGFYQEIADNLWQQPELEFRQKPGKIQFFQDVFCERLMKTILGYVGGAAEDSDMQRKIETKVEVFMNQPEVFCEDVIRYLTDYTGHTFVLMVDNFDHDIGNERLHINVLTVAKDAIERLKCPVFVPMRNYTRYGAFVRFAGRDVHQFRYLVLSKVNESDVLEIRRDYIIGKLMERRREEIYKQCKKYNVSAEETIKVLNVAWDAFQKDEAIFHFLCALSNSNLRTIWEIIRRVLQSGYFEPRDTSIDYDTFLKAALLDNNPFFEPFDERNRVINLYDNNEVFSSANCLVRIRVLQVLDYLDSPTILSKVLPRLSKAGYDESSVLDAVHSLAVARLIDIFPAPEAEIDENSIVGLSGPGKFYLHELALQVPYLRNVLPSCNVSQHVVGVLREIRKHDGKSMNADLAKELIRGYLVFADFIRAMEDQESLNVQGGGKRFFIDACPRIAPRLEESIKCYFSPFLQKDYRGYRYDRPG